MDPRSWLWRRKSLEKGPPETENSVSVCSPSEKQPAGDQKQEGLKGFPSTSQFHSQFLQASSSAGDNEFEETVKILTEKLSDALLSVSAKEDLVKQHTKVAEEAVSGWEQAEAEVAALRKQLEATIQKNSALESRIHDLDEALKDCLQQLHQSMEDQGAKIHDAIIKKDQEEESEKLGLEKQIMELKSQLEDAKLQAQTAPDHSLQERLEASENEIMGLKLELLARSKYVEVLMLEKELSNQTAETASKQNLENTKKIAKLEAECCRLRGLVHRESSGRDLKDLANNISTGSSIDTQSDNGESSIAGINNKLGYSGSWATALIAELDQFKNDKVSSRSFTTSVDIDLMDDFLEMERLVASPAADKIDPAVKEESNISTAFVRNYTIELEGKIEKMEREKAEIEKAFAESRHQLDVTRKQLAAAENRIVELQVQLELGGKSKQIAEHRLSVLEAQKEELESQLESAQLNVEKQDDKLQVLEAEQKVEKALSAELTTKLEIANATRKVLKSQIESDNRRIASLQQKLGLLEGQLEEGRVLSSEFATKIQSLDGTKRALESQLENAHSEIKDLQEKLSFLELKAQEERTSLCAEYASKATADAAARKELEHQLESAYSDCKRLDDKVSMLEETIGKERALSAELAAKCRYLDSVLTRIKRERQLRLMENTNGELKLQKEKELAVAAGKLEECQKTIASLGRQLTSLTKLDDFLLDAERTESNGGLPNLVVDNESKALQCGDPANFKSSSTFLTRLISSGRSSTRLEA